jgi:hypothetical protein
MASIRLGLSMPAAALAASVVAASTLAACSSGASPGQHSTATSAQPGGSTGTPGSAASGSGTPADPATKAAVTQAFEVFFSSASSTPQSEAALQNGASFHATLVQQSGSSYASSSSASVQSVRAAGDVAYVSFTILSNSKPLLAGFSGIAVRQAGTWKVSAQTFCGLLELEGSAPKACNDPSITALPK